MRFGRPPRCGVASPIHHVSFPAVADALASTQARLGRDVNPTVYSAVSPRRVAHRKGSRMNVDISRPNGFTLTSNAPSRGYIVANNLRWAQVVGGSNPP